MHIIPKGMRVSNTDYHCTLPFRLMIDGGPGGDIDYQEASPQQNLKMLMSGEVDAALIALSDFCSHGGLLGLDYGVGVVPDSCALMLYANDPAHVLSSVHLFQSASSSAVLLRLLFRERWRASPRFIRSQSAHSSRAPRLGIGKREGILVRHDMPQEALRDFSIREDVVAAWGELTGQPFTLMVWATVEDRLSRRDVQRLQDLLHCAATSRASFVRQAKESTVRDESSTLTDTRHAALLEHYRYYLDETLISGIESFCTLAARHRLLPASPYRSATYRLGSLKIRSRVPYRPAPQILAEVAGGERMSVRDACEVFDQASLADLSLAAEMSRRRVADHPRAVVAAELGCDVIHEFIRSGWSRAAARSVDVLRVVPGLRVHAGVISAPQYRELETVLRERERAMRGECWGPGRQRPALEVGVELRRVPHCKGEVVEAQRAIETLVAAGADVFYLSIQVRGERSGWRGELAAEAELLRDFHKYGARSNVVLNFSVSSVRDRTWVPSAMSLLKELRLVQDEIPGIRSVAVAPRRDGVQSGSGADWDRVQRFAAVVRLFLDNVPFVRAQIPLAFGDRCVPAARWGIGEFEFVAEGELPLTTTIQQRLEEVGISPSFLVPSLSAVRRPGADPIQPVFN